MPIEPIYLTKEETIKFAMCFIEDVKRILAERKLEITSNLRASDGDLKKEETI
jgi:hypothetical protein